MANDNGNKTLLIVIALLLVGILAVLVMQATKKTPEEKVADSISDTVDKIGDQFGGKKE